MSIGVPEKPIFTAFGSAIIMFWARSPYCERWIEKR